MRIDGYNLRETLYLVLDAAQDAALKCLGWEGDIRGGSAFGYVSPAGANGHRPHVSVGWKQDNNGQCFYGTTDRFLAAIIEENGPSNHVIVEVVTTFTVLGFDN